MPEEQKESQSAEVNGEAPAAQASEPEQLKATLAEKEKRLADAIDRLKHLQADFANYKKRAEREQQEYYRVIEDRLLLAILPLYDNFERAFRALGKNGDKDSFIEGMERVFSQFNAFLTQQQISPLETLGQPFDPACHEALMSVESDEKPNTIIEEFERGYRRGERLLRPSRVKVTRRAERAVIESPAPDDSAQPNTSQAEEE
jgi:molecular chaperone GrpE